MRSRRSAVRVWIDRKALKHWIPAALCALSALLIQVAWAEATTLGGNVAGAPASVGKLCPVHTGNTCSSTLVPSSVSYIGNPTAWFISTLTSAYSGPQWNFHYVGASPNLSGTYNVDYYKAYNDCGGLMGAEIKVTFAPNVGSTITDVLWVQAYSESWPGHSASAIDDRSHLPAAKQPGALFGPFYPYQDEDEDAPRWQAGVQYDFFYDKPGDPCPAPYTTTKLLFETYACTWDDYFNADGTITDLGDPGHHVYIYDGFGWGYELHCVPEPATLLASLLGLGGVGAYVRRRRLIAA